MKSLKFELKNQGGWTHCYVVGHLTEDAGVLLTELLDSVGKNCVLNMGRVETINSSGARHWIKFLAEFCATRKVEFEECAPVVVSQINMISSFNRGCKIRSVFAPYRCASCQIDINQLIPTDRFTSDKIQELAPRCSNCQQKMEFDEDEGYFEVAIQPSNGT